MVAPGKTTRNADHDDGQVNHDSLVNKSNKVAPGKLTEPAPVQVKGQGKQTQTGSDYVDNNAACGEGMDATCFLEAGQRARLIIAFQQRVLSAQVSYISALDEIRVDQLLEKDEDMGWVVELIFNAVFIGAGTALSKALVAFRDTKAIENAMKDAEIKMADSQTGLRSQLHGELRNIGHGHDPSLATDLATSFHGLNDASIGLVVKQAVDSGKKKATSAATAMSTEQHQTDKGSKLDYVAFLKDQSVTVFEGVRESTPAHVHDDALLALFKAYEGVNHTTTIYKKLLKDQIDTYAKSFVTRLGYSKPKDAAHAGIFELSEHPDKKVVKCVWLIETGKGTIPKPKLVYQSFMIQWGDKKTGDHYARVGDVDYHEVEHSLTEVAIARHQQIWGAPPETLVVDASLQPTWKTKKSWNDMTPAEKAKSPQTYKDAPKNDEGK